MVKGVLFLLLTRVSVLPLRSRTAGGPVRVGEEGTDGDLLDLVFSNRGFLS